MSAAYDQISEEKQTTPGSTINPIQFQKFFERKTATWTDHHSAEEVSQILCDMYRDFFHTKDINVSTIINALRGDIKDRKSLCGKARAFCKELFRIEYKQKSGIDVKQTENFLRLKNTYGHNIFAHGVEEAKGGLSNIVMMCITGSVRVPSLYWGLLIDGNPDISPVNHGPYFMIYGINLSPEDEIRNNASCEDVAYVLVPCVEVVYLLKEKLTKAKDLGLIDDDNLQRFQGKIVTYDQLYGICAGSVSEKSCHPKGRKHFLENVEDRYPEREQKKPRTAFFDTSRPTPQGIGHLGKDFGTSDQSKSP